jgi:hypothetical protein
MKKYISIFLLFCSLHGWSQNIPANRLTDFSRVGVQETKSVTAKKIDIDSVLRYNPQLDLSNYINTLINSEDSPFSFLFGNGDYSLNSTLNLEPHTKLLGFGKKTTLVFNTSDRHCIAIQGNKTNQEIAVSNTIRRGSSSITFDTPPKIIAGETYLLSSNDSSLVTSEWAIGSTGQLLTVKNVQGNRITFKEQFNRNHLIAAKPVLVKISPIENIQIYNLTIERTQEVAGQGSAIQLRYAKNCEIACVRFFNADFAHITFNQSANNTVEGCYFQDAFNYGGGGNGYGIVMQFASSNNLVYNNSFKHLRHSILLQAGANGNAIAYNYSTDPYWAETWLPSDAAGDLVLHGNYVYSNLLEGNCVQNIVIDGSHGKNGKHNIFLHNRAENFGLFMDPISPSDSQVFMGNEITNRFGNALYMLAGSGHFEYGNNVSGTVVPEGTDSIALNSLLPSYFYNNAKQLLVTSAGVNSPFNAAEMRFTSNLETACEQVILTATKPAPTNIILYPNPSNTYFSLDGLPANTLVEILNLSGHILKTTNKSSNIDISDLPSGCYFVRAIQGKNSYTRKLLVQ